MKHKNRTINEISYSAISQGRIAALEHSHGNPDDTFRAASYLEGKHVDLININATITTVEGAHQLLHLVNVAMRCFIDEKEYTRSRRIARDIFDDDDITHP